MLLEDLFEDNELEFVNRDKILDFPEREYMKMSREKGYFKVLSIYGIGGIGKSRLISEMQKRMEKYAANDRNLKILNLSLEIEGSADFLSALVRLRTQIPEVCPLFDYAFLLFWKQTKIVKLDDEFIKTLRNQWPPILKEIASFVSISGKALPNFIGIPMDTLFEIVESSFQFFRKKYYSNIFSHNGIRLENLSLKQLKNTLGNFLGVELNRLYYEKKLIAFIDAYKQFSDSMLTQWLPGMIEEAHTGLFIITSREQLNIPFSSDVFYPPKQLTELPKVNARELIRKELPDISEAITDHILEKSGCIPIYLKLAVSTYRKLIKQDRNILDTSFLFENQEDIINQFFGHLENSIQRFLVGLSFIQIFDIDIFEKMLSMFPLADITQFDKIHSLSFVSPTLSTKGFYKIHNVIHSNIIKTIDRDIRYKIFSEYLTFISKRTVFNVDEEQSFMLYQHLIRLVVDNSFELQEHETELLLDLFFYIKQTQMIIMPTGIPDFKNYAPLKNIFYFTKAVAEERNNTQIRLKYLSKIDSNNNFGKHNKSLKIINGYLNQWTGNSRILSSYVLDAYPKLDPNEIREWYYAQTVIFYADYQTIKGNFIKAENALYQFFEGIKKFREQSNSIFQCQRHQGHLYRFNFFLYKANRKYLATRNQQKKFDNFIEEIYILTNLCETNCYFYPEVVCGICRHALILSKRLKDLKSQAKIYYSMAIVCIHRKKYKRAKKYIHKSLYLDEKDGYSLGHLFPLLAEIYLNYALNHPLNTTNFEQLLSQFDVYGFLQLPVAILQNNNNTVSEIHSKYEWLDFQKTVKAYKKFFSIIKPVQPQN